MQKMTMLAMSPVVLSVALLFSSTAIGVDNDCGSASLDKNTHVEATTGHSVGDDGEQTADDVVFRGGVMCLRTKGVASADENSDDPLPLEGKEETAQ